MNTAEQGNNAKQLKGRFTVAVLVFFIALLAAMAATYAWYVYNTGRHTTKVRMSARYRESISRSVTNTMTKPHTKYEFKIQLTSEQVKNLATEPLKIDFSYFVKSDKALEDLGTQAQYAQL